MSLQKTTLANRPCVRKPLAASHGGVLPGYIIGLHSFRASAAIRPASILSRLLEKPCNNSYPQRCAFRNYTRRMSLVGTKYAFPGGPRASASAHIGLDHEMRGFSVSCRSRSPRQHVLTANKRQSIYSNSLPTPQTSSPITVCEIERASNRQGCSPIGFRYATGTPNA